MDGDLLTYFDFLVIVVLAFGGEAVHVDHGQLGLCVRGEEVFVVVVQTGEGGEEGRGCGGEVHDVVVEGSGLRDALPAGS